jgi:hypothetical protein
MLEHLHIVGCPKVTHRGVWYLVSASSNGLVGLGFENLAPTFVGSLLDITGVLSLMTCSRIYPTSASAVMSQMHYIVCDLSPSL